MSEHVTGRILQNRYRLERRLGYGAMAEVFRAHDLQLDRPVAIKLAHAHLASDPAFVQRLNVEARTIAALTHPNIVTIYDQGDEGGQPFIVMELVEGETLAELLGRQRQLPVDSAIAIARDVLAALAHAHGRCIVHRDVKPQNILVTSEGRAKLADLGIAQVAANLALTRAGEVLGSIHYIAPERLLGQPASPAADIYAVGVILYETLAGQLPFEGDSAVAIAAQHHHRDPVPLATLRADSPAWLGEVVLRAMAKDPASRYATAMAMREDLERRRLAVHDAPTMVIPVATASEPVNAPSPAPVRRPKRRWLAVSAAALGAAALLGAVALPFGGLSSTLAPFPDFQPEAASPRPSPTSATPAGATVIATATSQRTTATATTITSAEVVSTATAIPPPTATATPALTETPLPPAGTSTPAPPLQRIDELRDFVQRLSLRGQGAKEQREWLNKLVTIEEAIARGDTKAATEKVQDLLKDVQKAASDHKIDRALADQIISRLTAVLG